MIDISVYIYLSIRNACFWFRKKQMIRFILIWISLSISTTIIRSDDDYDFSDNSTQSTASLSNPLYPRGNIMDPSTYANIQQYKPIHLSFDTLFIDFNTLSIYGTVIHTFISYDNSNNNNNIYDNSSILRNKDEETPLSTIYLDVYDSIEIQSAQFRIDDNDSNSPLNNSSSLPSSLSFAEYSANNECRYINNNSNSSDIWMDVMSYEITTPNPNIGNSLDIVLPCTIPYGHKVYVKLQYISLPNASNALHWIVDPSDITGNVPDDYYGAYSTDTTTNTNNNPQMMYSSCTMNYCRDMVPIMDTPSQKITYDATIIVPNGYSVYMSAANEGVSTQPYNTTHTLVIVNNTIPIPSYLLSIAVGNTFREQSISDEISIVASSQSMLDTAVGTLKDTIPTLLNLVQDYVQIQYYWGNFTIIVMPYSFESTGMVRMYLCVCFLVVICFCNLDYFFMYLWMVF